MFCARYLAASDALERSGAVATAVHAGGYASEKEKEGKEKGSSFEEQQHAEEEGDDLPPGAYMHEADEITKLPSHREYSHGFSELAQAGYLVRSSIALVAIIADALLNRTIKGHVEHPRQTTARTCRVAPASASRKSRLRATHRILALTQPRMRTQRTRLMVRGRLKTRARLPAGVQAGTAGSVRACEKVSPTPSVRYFYFRLSPLLGLP